MIVVHGADLCFLELGGVVSVGEIDTASHIEVVDFSWLSSGVALLQLYNLGAQADLLQMDRSPAARGHQHRVPRPQCRLLRTFSASWLMY